MIAYTFTGPDARRPFRGDRWPPPGEWATAGRGSRVDHLPVWIAAELWLVELEGSVHEVATQLRADRGRLVRRIETWDDAAAGEFARWCGRRILELSGPADGDERMNAYRADAEAFAAPTEANAAGWVATRAAAALGGEDGAARERARQAGWLQERLHLDPAPRV